MFIIQCTRETTNEWEFPSTPLSQTHIPICMYYLVCSEIICIFINLSSRHTWHFQIKYCEVLPRSGLLMVLLERTPLKMLRFAEKTLLHDDALSEFAKLLCDFQKTINRLLFCSKTFHTFKLNRIHACLFFVINPTQQLTEDFHAIVMSRRDRRSSIHADYPETEGWIMCLNVWICVREGVAELIATWIGYHSTWKSRRSLSTKETQSSLLI